jgi:hypothetical protein
MEVSECTIDLLGMHNTVISWYNASDAGQGSPPPQLAGGTAIVAHVVHVCTDSDWFEPSD